MPVSPQSAPAVSVMILSLSGCYHIQGSLSSRAPVNVLLEFHQNLNSEKGAGILGKETQKDPWQDEYSDDIVLRILPSCHGCFFISITTAGMQR